ncbi:MAG: 1-deoxy-D-xylulose-5-phosphate reductoisomerase [Ignavibacteriae bacterium HGW-Ignavibacteriae-4]|jgi:1-deoxy-D-xylulose-5-phosphate reductoisomerase|nr:MAG: 1-deoxy-D-xylulose-5-phosphate reductoisomerase [Ignavibacteriae bacterium HGW-Ignavibacteriae-4]
MERRNISILGSTGSIGTQTLDVISLTQNIEINYLTTNSNIDLLEIQCVNFNPKGVVVTDYESFKQFKSKTSFKGEIHFGDDGLNLVTSDISTNLLISSLVGFAGVIPTLNAINNKIDVALANKETLVAAGEIITKAAKDNNVNIFPIDSEHSAIQQCLTGEKMEEVEKIILTASGGPFLDTSYDSFDSITIKDALNHPNWTMGSKITIDSATLMNKGLEVIEAYWLFGLKIEEIDVIIHPQSIIHSMVQFSDSSVKAQLGLPDMKVPIAYAINFPHHKPYPFKRMNLADIGSLTFFEPDYNKFPNLKLAFKALEKGGTSCCVLNAVNEITVQQFLDGNISFKSISDINSLMLDKIESISNPSIQDIIEADKNARIITNEYIKSANGIS